MTNLCNKYFIFLCISKKMENCSWKRCRSDEQEGNLAPLFRGVQKKIGVFEAVKGIYIQEV